MKKTTLILLLHACILAAWAQTLSSTNVNERLFDAKVREPVYRLHITKEQENEFIPIYRRYNEEMTALWKDARNKRSMTSGRNKVEYTKRKIERQQQAQNIRLRFIDVFAAVLNEVQLSRLYEVESIIQKKLIRRKQNKSGKHTGQRR